MKVPPSYRCVRLGFGAVGLCAIVAGVTAVADPEMPDPPSEATSRAIFLGLGHLPGGIPFSRGLDVSADGLAVVGVSSSEVGPQAYRWTFFDGMMGLGDLPGGSFNSVASGVSEGGGVVTGWSTSSFGAQEAFVWTSGEGIAGLGDLPGGAFGSAGAAVSTMGLGDDDDDNDDFDDDGSDLVIVGWGSPRDGELEAFRWTPFGGLSGLGDLPGGFFASRAVAVSADGTVVAGTGNSGPLGVNEAFRWTQGEGMVGLGFLPDALQEGSQATDMTADGSVIVGAGWARVGIEALYWTADEGMIALGDLPGGGPQPFSFAFGVSDDGKTIVGKGTTDIGGEAFVWDDERDMRNLRDVLAAVSQIDLSDWVLVEARAVSADGLTIVGTGNHDGVEEAWLARLPDPCPADLNDDGTVDVDDLLILAGSMGPCPVCDLPPMCPADLNGDCVVGVLDLAILLASWGDCP
ncbi:MAG: PEP-CTERM sorting domain-containing protein [Planctomycetota bacterium]